MPRNISELKNEQENRLDHMGNHSPGVSRCGILTSLFGITEMNKQIYELAKQAGLIEFEAIPGSKAVTPTYESIVRAQTFAELIVKQCTNLLDEDSCIMPELGGYAHDMRKMFGVDI
jgi:hypothetical protein